MIAKAFIDKIASELTGKPVGPEVISMLRAKFEGAHFTHCLEDELTGDPTPAYEGGTFNLYLVDGSDHCMHLTTHADSATGILVAEVEEEE